MQISESITTFMLPWYAENLERHHICRSKYDKMSCASNDIFRDEIDFDALSQDCSR